MMMPKLAGLWLLAMVFVSCAGCATHFKLDSHPVAAWPPHQQVGKQVRLLLTPEFTQYEYVEHFMSDSWHYPMGPALAANAEAMAKQAFDSVFVDRGTAITSTRSIPTLVPSVSDTQLVRGWNMEMTMDLCWSLYDPKGNLLWMETVRGEGTNFYGTGFTFRANARKRVKLLMEDVFTRSLAVLTNAPTVRAAFSSGAEVTLHPR